jgi:hypothetical protein
MEIYFNVKLPHQFEMDNIVCESEDEVAEVLSSLPLYTKFDSVTTAVFSKQRLELDFGVPLEKGHYRYKEDVEDQMETDEVIVQPMIVYNKSQSEHLGEEYIKIKEMLQERYANRQKELLEVELEDDSD